MDQALIWKLDIAMKYQTRQDADMLRNLRSLKDECVDIHENVFLMYL